MSKSPSSGIRPLELELQFYHSLIGTMQVKYSAQCGRIPRAYQMCYRRVADKGSAMEVYLSEEGRKWAPAIPRQQWEVFPGQMCRDGTTGLGGRHHRSAV
jgi:hypothetical protein